VQRNLLSRKTNEPVKIRTSTKAITAKTDFKNVAYVDHTVEEVNLMIQEHKESPSYVDGVIQGITEEDLVLC